MGRACRPLDSCGEEGVVVVLGRREGRVVGRLQGLLRGGLLRIHRVCRLLARHRLRGAAVPPEVAIAAAVDGQSDGGSGSGVAAVSLQDGLPLVRALSARRYCSSARLALRPLLAYGSSAACNSAESREAACIASAMRCWRVSQKGQWSAMACQPYQIHSQRDGVYKSLHCDTCVVRWRSTLYTWRNGTTRSPANSASRATSGSAHSLHSASCTSCAMRGTFSRSLYASWTRCRPWRTGPSRPPTSRW